MRCAPVLAGFLIAGAVGCGRSSSATQGDAGPHSSSQVATGSSSSSATATHSSTTTTGTGGSSSSSRSMSSSGDAAGPPGADVLMMHNHINRDGTFIDGAITFSTAPTFDVDTTFDGTVSGDVYASPLYVESGVHGAGTFFVVTENDMVYALDEQTGAVDWQTDLGPPATQTGTCGNIRPIGITGTPAIDLTTRLMVLDGVVGGLDGGFLSTHKIYALSIDTGAVAWSLDVSTQSFGSLPFTPNLQQQRGGVLILNGTAYVAYGGNDGDCDAYHGWVVGVPLSGVGAEAWATTAQGAGIWGAGGPSSDGQSIFVTTGNGHNDMTSWGESEGLFRLGPGPTYNGSNLDASTKDYFSPYTWEYLDVEDLDLSGSAPLVIDAPSMTPSALVLAQGKDGNLYLLRRDDLGGIATPGRPANVGSINLFTDSGKIINAAASATADGTTYVVVRPNGFGTQSNSTACPGTPGDIVVVKLDPTAPQKMSVAWCGSSAGVGSPSITTSNGNDDALVWVFSANSGNGPISASRPDATGQSGLGTLFAWNLATGAPVLSGRTQPIQHVRSLTTPIAVHGRIFVGGDGQLHAFKAKGDAAAP